MPAISIGNRMGAISHACNCMLMKIDYILLLNR